MAWRGQPKTFPGNSQAMMAWQDSPTSWGLDFYSTEALGWRGLVMELDATEAPVTAWCESVQGGTRVGVARWRQSEASWVSALPTRPGLVANPALVLQRDGNPVVAWSETGAIQVHRWTGTAWEQLGQSFPTLTTQSELAAPVLALDGAGQLLFAWSRPGKAELWRWTDRGWVRLGELSRPTSSQVNTLWPLSLQVNAGGVPVLAWSQQDPTHSTFGYVEAFRFNR
jgi:hypothetical protein